MIPEVRARVAVIQTTTERDHNSEASQEAYDDLRQSMPWIEFEFHDEHSIDRCFRHMADGRFSSVIFASNSLFNSVIYDATLRATGTIQQRSELGMGIVILQQFLPAGQSRECTFLPLRHQVTFRAVDRPPITALNVSEKTIRVLNGDKFHDVLDQFVDRAAVLWSIAEPQFAGEWSQIASAETADGQVTVIQRSRSPRARTIVSSLPLDWLASRDLLANLVARSVMFSGTLYVHPAGKRESTEVPLRIALGHAARAGRHLSSHQVSTLADIDVNGYPYRHFNHLLIHPSWGWADLEGDLRQKLRRRLENDGSITACADQVVTGVPMMVTVGGRPAYLGLADRFALWQAVSNMPIDGEPTTPVRALAALAAAVNKVVEHDDAIPRLLHLAHLRRQLGPYFEKRLRNGVDNVDEHPLPTAAVASAMSLLEFSSKQVDPLKRWLERGDYRSSAASLRQARLWLPDLDLDLGTVPAPGTDLDRLYQALTAATDGASGPTALDSLATMLQNPKLSVARRAIIAESLTASNRPDAMAVVAASARGLHDDLDRAYNQSHPSLELLALLTAALVRIHADAGLSTAAAIGHVSLDGRGGRGEVMRVAQPHDPSRERRSEANDTRGTTPEAVVVGLDKELRAELEIERDRRRAMTEKIADLQAEKSTTEQFGRVAVGLLALIFWAVVVSVAIWIGVEAADGLGDVLPLIGTAAVVLGVGTRWLGKKSAKAGCEPNFIAAIRFWPGT